MSSDVLAFATLTAIHQHGLRIPDDIAVVGFDDNPLSRYAYPPLTSVYLPFEEMGRRAGEMLLDLLSTPRRAEAGDLVGWSVDRSRVFKQAFVTYPLW